MWLARVTAEGRNRMHALKKITRQLEQTLRRETLKGNIYKFLTLAKFKKHFFLLKAGEYKKSGVW